MILEVLKFLFSATLILFWVIFALNIVIAFNERKKPSNRVLTRKDVEAIVKAEIAAKENK